MPSRALINEYYDRVSELVNTKKVNVLSFVDQINTKHANRNVSFDWRVTVANNNTVWDVIEVEAPRLHELRSPEITEKEVLVWPFSAGEFLDAPALKGSQSVTYPDHAGLPFLILTGKYCGFYFGLHDKMLITSHVNSKANGGQNAIELAFTRVHRIKYGEKRTDHFATIPAISPFESNTGVYEL